MFFITNKVISGVCSSIFNSFGHEFPIYKELVKQNLIEPSFFVECISHKRSQELNNRFFRQHSICISYFPSSSDYRFECNSVFEKLFLALDFILVDDNLISAKNLRCEFADAKNQRLEFSHTIMKVFVDYDFFTYEQLQFCNLMQDLSINTTERS